MNLGLFNRMNLKESSENKGMYSEWTSLSLMLQNNDDANQSVLEKFGLTTSKDVTLGVVRQLASNLGISQPAEPSPLVTDKEVQWCMEVLCFGLSLPLSEHEAIKDCVNVYCEWLSALLTPKICVPQPIVEDPNVYARKIIAHLHYLFIPRKDEGIDTINRQAVLCHRVLRTLQQIAHESKLLERETWEALLLFLLAINDTLLSPPTVKDDVADQLCERVLSVLFEIWLIACAQCFPSPPLWKTLRECCMNWRHRVALIEQWNRVNLVLTSKVLSFMYGPTFPELKIGDDDLITHGMSNDCIAQSWYRFLNTIGNPISLTKPEVISQTQKFLQFAISTDNVNDPCQHPCLQALPLIFLKAIKGIAGQVDAFLGIPKSSLIGLTTSRSSVVATASAPSSGPSSTSSISSLTSFGPESRTPLAPGRPKCNSILHLFGEWLFEAAFLGCDLQHRQPHDQNKRNSSVLMESYSQPSSISDIPSLPSSLTIDKYESGKAEALGTLCRIMCAKKTGEEILPVYLARFYLAVQQGLKIAPNRECGETMVAILMNSSDLFRLDLDGVRVLVPVFISALEIVLPDKDLKLNSNVSKTELRRASIHLLSSMLVLPLHFQNVVIKDLINTGSSDRPCTFGQLKPRLMNLVMNALQIESDPQNTHMLLGSLFLCVQDSSIYEKVEQVTQPPTDTSSNLLSSDSAHALFVRATYLVCHRLISSWKTDLNVSLAALELLSGLARIHIKESDAMECKRAVKWLCDYIVYQCSRPPPAHSKDLHSTIVAAFQCCSVWLLEHPYLLRDKDCLTTVLEVAELGVSGTKSVGKPGENVKMKEQKELKPASMRVRDAAENLLTCILEQVGYFPNECGPESISSLLDEVALLQHCNSWPTNCTDQATAVEKFRYFVTEGSVVLALLEEPLGNDQDPQPTVTILIRGPFGRHAWTMQLRHLPRHRSGTKCHAPNPGRPVVMQETPLCPQVKQKYFPDSVDRVTQCKVDQSIPLLDTVIAQNEEINEDTNKLVQLIERQATVETNLAATQSNFVAQECTPPPVVHDFQTSRLFLSHFGLLSLGDENDEAPTLTALDSSAGDFCKDLSLLDHLSPRTCDTVHIFYVKSQQVDAQDIVNNVRTEQGISSYFFEFIHTLGWPVEVNKHPGWTGHVSTSWKVSPQESPVASRSTSYDGSTHVLYWADACAEIAFVVPSTIKPADPPSEQSSFNASIWYERSLSETSTTSKDKRALSLELDKQPVPPRRSGPRSNLHPFTNTKIMVVWLESFEDHLNLPIDDLLNSMTTGLERGAIIKSSEVLVIYLHLMASGLLRVHLQGPSGRVGLASPLVDGMVLSRRALGPLVRHTALNMARRRRLDSDSYQPPHIRRRLKIQEMVQKYKREMTKPELLTYLFSST
ncbi:ral GTPase-activating protein subunit beta isoform X6 [Zophobas morio]|uniref:ral GTPase-activating protein subunit beta isoform X6 n=1 Tax=Zophobas morio TaxID=2755281 RepID=UPI003083E012